ncbi:stearoyl-CoA desaturase 5-like protein [Leptotrombidium deliense]|uniref:Stearoyl-CoA desaturase 5-like protein n=1 Tax=Leptotrombidium deliense TaxID=299467 RepID=A0A443SMD1_9ACAR|nr:stearoyl-CoA desaturase 5-like protein [Leptotrombidium deliense]
MDTKDVKSFEFESVVEVENIEEKPFKRKIVWLSVLKYALLHVFGVYGLLLSVTTCKLATLPFTFILIYISGLGVTAGAHRLWSHRSYKAKWPLRLLLALFNTIAFDKNIYEWCIDHRVHHKYSETPADPHTIKEGFFFSQIGWRMLSQRPEFIEKKNKHDFSDLWNDPIVKYQKILWYPLVLIFSFLLPTAIPFLIWREDVFTAFFICACLRWLFTSHVKWTVNSVAHRWGPKPYDKTNGNACENKLVIWSAFGEGFHNYHHAFPWDYKTSEFDWKYNMNLTAAFIDFFAFFGQAYDLRTASSEVIEARRLRTGEPLDPNCAPRKRNFCEWIIVVILFLLPLGFWFLSHFAINEALNAIFGFYVKCNIHDFVLSYFTSLASTYIHPNLAIFQWKFTCK